jgi:hypothetical protein
MIYSTEKNEMNIPCENKSNRIEDDFVNEVCEMVIEALNVNYNERRLVKPLLHKAIVEKLNRNYKKEGLLQQFEAYVLDTASKRLIDTFSLASVVNHEHACHAKFADIVKEIETKLPK